MKWLKKLFPKEPTWEESIKFYERYSTKELIKVLYSAQVYYQEDGNAVISILLKRFFNEVDKPKK